MLGVLEDDELVLEECEVVFHDYNSLMAFNRRQHLQDIITSLRMDLDTATDRKGSPQTLVCTKNRRSYRTRCEQYRIEIASLRTLGEFAAEIESAPSVERIKAAIARAEAYREI